MRAAARIQLGEQVEGVLVQAARRLTVVLAAGGRTVQDGILGMIATTPTWLTRRPGLLEMLLVERNHVLIDLVNAEVEERLRWKTSAIWTRAMSPSVVFAAAREWRREVQCLRDSVVETWVRAGRPEGHASKPGWPRWSTIIGGVLEVAGMGALLREIAGGAA